MLTVFDYALQMRVIILLS